MLAGPRCTLSELMIGMPEDLPRVDGWEEMPAVGLEVDSSVCDNPSPNCPFSGLANTGLSR